MRRAVAANIAIVLAAMGCRDDHVVHKLMGALAVTVVNAGVHASAIDLTLRCDADSRDVGQPALDSTRIAASELPPGACRARVVARDSGGLPLRAGWFDGILIVGGQTTELKADLADAAQPGLPAHLCDGTSADQAVDRVLTCARCTQGLEAETDDDVRCPVIACDQYATYERRGGDGGGLACVKLSRADVTEKRCVSLGHCLEQSEAACDARSAVQESVVASLEASDLCHAIDGCAGAIAPTVSVFLDGARCGSHQWCQSGKCVCAPDCVGKVCGPDGCGATCGDCKVATEICTSDGRCAQNLGCADATREGFQSVADYPRIASCSGGWSVAGVTRDDLAPACSRQSGNNGPLQEGTGCSAADLCAQGWHVCLGRTEVGAKAGANGCRDSVPSGSPEKAMFFAVQQRSEGNNVCDDSSPGDNDVFGCGNLGIKLTVDKGCGVLTRTLASTVAGSCGYNEAEPPYGPWQCAGGATSDLHEGGIVTKSGCPNQSCTWDSKATANWDRGGVLCCLD